MKNLRAFIAIKIPDLIQKKLEETRNLLEIPRSTAVRWVTPSDIHLTLKFLGEIPFSDIERIHTAMLETVAGYHPFSVEVYGLGAFPGLNRPRVFWVGLRHYEDLLRLQSQIDQILLTLGHKGEDRPFTPHLTLGRVSDQAVPAEIRRIVEKIQLSKVDTLGEIHVDCIHLIRSELKPGGPIYTLLKTWDLAWFSFAKEANLINFDFAHSIVDALEEKKGEEILLIDIHTLVDFTDYFVVCTGTSNRMLDALADAAIERARTQFKIKGKLEGTSDEGWLVVDLGNVVVHVFTSEQRKYYQLEKLWERGKILLHLQ
jgi:2'-5' RNA ligase/ribosome silencing factor RsfS/YbeB/iojap